MLFDTDTVVEALALELGTVLMLSLMLALMLAVMLEMVRHWCS
jgi:hypothetical protein